jgi:hypothetical protein
MARRTRNSLLGVLLLALAGCATPPAVIPQRCPTPPGELLVKPQALPEIKQKTLNQPQAMAIWLNQIQLFELQRDRYSRLQKWGATQCKWSAPSPVKLEN